MSRGLLAGAEAIGKAAGACALPGTRSSQWEERAEEGNETGRKSLNQLSHMKDPIPSSAAIRRHLLPLGEG